MEISFYKQNAFVIKSADRKIIVDPGRSMMTFCSLIPKREWGNVDFILVTHNHPDHIACVHKIAKISNSRVICHKSLEQLMAKKGIQRIVAIAEDDEVGIEGFKIRGITVEHGPKKRRGEKRGEIGSIGFLFELEEKKILNLGDTIFLESWKGLSADILMVPIGGYYTMDMDEALKAVELIQPKFVIPTHYNWCIGPYVHRINYRKFVDDATQKGFQCILLRKGESTKI